MSLENNLKVHIVNNKARRPSKPIGTKPSSIGGKIPNIKITIPNSGNGIPAAAKLKHTPKTFNSERIDVQNPPKFKITKTISERDRIRKPKALFRKDINGDSRGGSSFDFVGTTKLSRPPRPISFKSTSNGYENGLGPSLLERGSYMSGFAQKQRDFRNNDNLQLHSGSRLDISNLDQGILEQDLLVIFKKIGDVKSIKINYDRSGRSNGTGHVIMARHRDAVEAMKLYQGANLDSKPLFITMGSSLHDDIKRL